MTNCPQEAVDPLFIALDINSRYAYKDMGAIDGTKACSPDIL